MLPKLSHIINIMQVALGMINHVSTLHGCREMQLTGAGKVGTIARQRHNQRLEFFSLLSLYETFDVRWCRFLGNIFAVM